MATGSYPFGGSPPVFTLGEILLYRLQVTVSDNWACAYINGSGSFTNYATIDSFINVLKSSCLLVPTGSLPPFGPNDSPPDILVRIPCYVVVLLSSPDQPSLCFQSTPMTTGADCSSQYFCLTEPYKDNDGNPRVLYFAVPSVASYTQNVSDPYTMFLQYTSGGSTITHSIDPSIKNRGTPPG